MWRLLFASFFIPLGLEAQNLIPNSDFEDYYDCPTQIGQLHLAKHWFSPNGGTPEYFNSTCKSEWNKAHRGDGYVGLILFGQYTKIVEYIGIELSEPLVAKEDYDISFQVRADRSPIYIDRIDFVAVDEDPSIKHWAPLRLKSNFSHSGTIIKNQDSWKEIAGTFTAEGGERFVIIGNFQHEAQLLQEADPQVKERKPGWYSYYLIDDVVLSAKNANIHKEQVVEIQELKSTEFKLRPILFDFDSFALRSSERLYLDSLVTFLKTEAKSMTLTGHTDSLGSRTYNSLLSKKRVEGVFNYLSSRGLLPSMLQSGYEGEDLPSNPNTSPRERAINRRVEITFIQP